MLIRISVWEAGVLISRLHCKVIKKKNIQISEIAELFSGDTYFPRSKGSSVYLMGISMPKINLCAKYKKD